MTTTDDRAAASALPEAAPVTTDPRNPAEAVEEAPLTAESLIEEVSIDGMCGVY
jgi:mycofactocin precursor